MGMNNNDQIIMLSVALAAEAHKDAKRRYSGTPYLFHPLRVMGRVMAHPNAEAIHGAAGVLHDTHEDPPYISLERIAKIHPQVAVYVGNLTSPSKKLELPDGTYPKEWPRRKRTQLNLDHLHECDYWEQTIKCYDRIDNLTEILHDLHGWGRRPEEDFVELYCDESMRLSRTADKTEQWQRDELNRCISILRSMAATAYHH